MPSISPSSGAPRKSPASPLISSRPPDMRGTREGAAIAGDNELAAAHAAPERFAAIAFDDDLAALQVLADIVEARRSALEPDRFRAAGADLENVADGMTFSRVVCNSICGDLLGSDLPSRRCGTRGARSSR